MLLSRLFPDAPLGGDVDVTMLCENSQNVQGAAVFFAHVGSKENGVKYIGDALMRGCAAIVVPMDANIDINIPSHVSLIRVKNTRAEISRCAATMYGPVPQHIVAVTGTSGKTSTTYFVQQILNFCRLRAVSLGTIGIAGAITRDGTLTTPEAPELHQTLRDLAAQHISHVAMEASSQALDQHRMDHVRVQAAAFTNLSRDHLDYHGSLDNYLAAKKRLFGHIVPIGGTAVLNADDATFDELRELCQNRSINVLSFGQNGHDIRLDHHHLHHDGQQLDMTIKGKPVSIKTGIVGAFQGENMMAAMGLCLALDIPVDDIITAMGHIQAPPGRMQMVLGHPTGAGVYVDYAHKPDALENVLKSMRAHTSGRLVVVFGCGGDRDAGKRPIMGEIAGRLADDIIITDDNPRSEDPEKIRAAIAAACPKATIIGDRRAAIQAAIAALNPGDNLIVAGKGHEQGQKFADRTDPFDDVVECENAIASLPSSSPQGSRA